MQIFVCYGNSFNPLVEWTLLERYVIEKTRSTRGTSWGNKKSWHNTCRLIEPRYPPPNLASAFHFWELPDSSGPFLLHHLIFQVAPRSTRDVLLGFMHSFQFSDFEEFSWLMPKIVVRLSSSLHRSSYSFVPDWTLRGISTDFPIFRLWRVFLIIIKERRTSQRLFVIPSHSFVPDWTSWRFVFQQLPHHNLQVSEKYLTAPAKEIVR